MNFAFRVKFGGAFRNLIKIDKLDWCSIMETAKSFTNSYAKALFKDMKKSIPRLFDPCPLSGLIQLVNIAPQEKLFSILPSAKLRCKISIADLKEAYVFFDMEKFH